MLIHTFEALQASISHLARPQSHSGPRRTRLHRAPGGRPLPRAVGHRQNPLRDRPRRQGGVKAGKSVFLSTLADIVASLLKAEREGQLRERNRFLARNALPIVDEIGYLPLSLGSANPFFRLVDARHERRAMILTSNCGFDEWAESSATTLPPPCSSIVCSTMPSSSRSKAPTTASASASMRVFLAFCRDLLQSEAGGVALACWDACAASCARLRTTTQSLPQPRASQHRPGSGADRPQPTIAHGSLR